jgi:putative membrane protein
MRMSITDLPSLNAFLNGLAALLLFSGFLFIRRKNVAAHRACMLSAVLVSTAFLISYLVYHYHVGSIAYRGQGWSRIFYFAILLTHTVLAAAIVPLVLVTLVRALRGRFERHARIARWTLPIWIYVSITGVLIYLMLY